MPFLLHRDRLCPLDCSSFSRCRPPRLLRESAPHLALRGTLDELFLILAWFLAPSLLNASDKGLHSLRLSEQRQTFFYRIGK